MAVLMLRLAAPMQSWGTDSKFEVRKTNREPTKSGVVGLLAAALGARRDQTEILRRLNKLRIAVRVDREGTLLRDFHTAKSDKTSYVTRRYYLSDAVFLVGLEDEDEEYLRSLEHALRNPAFPLFLGRRSCPPTLPLCLGMRDGSLEQALRAEPSLVPVCRGDIKKRKIRVLLETGPEAPGAVVQQDLPLSFSPEHRQYGYRAVREEVWDTVPLPEPTEHDPFKELR